MTMSPSDMNGSDSQEKLLADIPKVHARALWTQMSTLVPPRPKPKAIAHKWDYTGLRSHLIRAGKLVSEHEAERRVLMLINPQMEPPYTTDTLYAGLQLVLPGETAPAHRHTAFAVRFIIEGKGGYTAVQGRRINMTRGDFILTPTWEFHDHGNDGAGEPVIWLDGLDLPQFQHFPVHFAQGYSEPRYPAKNVVESEILFPWGPVQTKLDSRGEPHAIERYTSKVPGREGEEVSPRIGAQSERLEVGCKSATVRESSSAVYHVVEGEGRTEIGGKVMAWKRGDTFSVPSWEPYHHEAETLVYLFRFDDKPMLKALNMYRNEDEGFLV